MEEIMKDIDHAFNVVSNMLVSGENADAVAVTRAKLRSAYSRCEAMKKESEKAPVKED